MMQKVAVTGNIGSGKTTVCKIFESLGIPVFYADKEAKKCYDRSEVIVAVKEIFGKQVFNDDEQLLFSEMSRIAFNDPEILKRLNAIIHPLVLQDFMAWTKNHREEDYIIYESALLFESGFNIYFDISILVTAPRQLALSRVMKRDGLSESEFLKRLARQQSEEKMLTLANHVIRNDETRPLIPQIIDLHKLFISKK